MRTKRNLLVATMLGLATLVPPTTSESAPMRAPISTVDSQSDVLSVAWRRVCNRRRCHRVWVGRRVIVRPRVVIRARPVVRQRVIVRDSDDLHVQWCLNRYRSYSPATDTYLGYDGYYHTCVSPYD